MEVIMRAREIPQHLMKYFEPLPRKSVSDVMNFPTSPFHGAHYAAFPPELARRCILAGTSEAGCCPACQAPYVRQLDRITGDVPSYNGSSFVRGKTHDARFPLAAIGTGERTVAVHTTGWAPSCTCAAGEPVPNVVFDPFTGSSTTLLVARALGRHAIGCDLSWTYLHKQSRERLGSEALDRWLGKKDTTDGSANVVGLPLFDPDLVL